MGVPSTIRHDRQALWDGLRCNARQRGSSRGQFPKIDRDSVTYLIAQLSVETGIPPSEWLAMDERMFRAILSYLNEKSKAVKNANQGRRRK